MPPELDTPDLGTDESVHQQYEAYPYPARDPRDEAKRLITGSPSQLAEVNHYLFAGTRDFRQPFRALVAGGGTGDAAVMLAQQLRDRNCPGEVVYLDISRAARSIAEARAEARGLTNLVFHTAPIESLPGLDLGRFDYIDCCGVLHHLADPAAGLTALRALLAPGGGLGVMLYGTLGRRGVYQVQEMMRSLAAGLPLGRQVELARRLLAALPATNGFARNPFLGDHKRSDAELVDLLLHSRDRAYRVHEIAELCAQAGLPLVGFVPPARYEPGSYLRDPRLLDRLQGKPALERAAFAERLAGNIKTHVFYLAPPRGPGEAVQDRIARPAPDMVPRLIGQDAAVLAQAVGRDLVLRSEVDGLKLRFALPRLAPAILREIDGRRTIGQIGEVLGQRDSALDGGHFAAQFDRLYRVLNGLNLLLLSRAL